MTLTDKMICDVFSGADDFERRELMCGTDLVFSYYIDGLVSGDAVAETVYKPILLNHWGDSTNENLQRAMLERIYNASVTLCSDLDAVCKKLVNGFCVLLLPEGSALAFEVKTGEKRSPSSPEIENTVKGPKDAFVETLRTNTSLVRRHLRDPYMRIWETEIGVRTGTRVALLWLEEITDPDIVSSMKKRIRNISVDGFLSPAAVEEYLTGSRKTAFPMIQYTERTDRFCQGLLDGRIGILVDGLPVGYLAPIDIQYLMESQEDRGRDYISASVIRLLRYCALFLSLLLPGIYIAVCCFQPEMIPLPLLRAIIRSKESVPFSTITEVLGLLIAFDLLQEAGIHLPQAMGQTVSIIGGIVVGSAAVDAGLISPAALISVSIAGVCGFVLPNQDLAYAIQVWRFAVAIGGAIGGLLGVTVVFLLLMIHLAGLSDFGVDYLAPFSNGKGKILRYRLKMEKTRDPLLNPLDRRRQK